MIKQEPTLCGLQETHLKVKDTYKLKVRGWKKIFHMNGKDREAVVAILISDKIDFKTKSIKKENFGSSLCGSVVNEPDLRIQVQFLASISGLRIQHCCELWYRLPMWLRSCIAVAVVQASSCSSDSTPSLGTSI